jgi:hypothetical protein
VEDDQVGVGAREMRRERRRDRDRTGCRDSADSCDVNAIDRFLDGLAAGVHHEHVTLHQLCARAAERFDDPLHPARHRRIELADVQHTLQTSAWRGGTGRPATAP